MYPIVLRAPEAYVYRSIGREDRVKCALFMEEIKHHETLFTGPSLEIGKIHWYILRTYNAMESKKYVEKDQNNSSQPEGGEIVITPLSMDLTPFGEEVGTDEIHWWVFKKENNVDELLEKTNNALRSVQKLKEDSSLLKERFVPDSYKNLVEGVKEFAKQHAEEIKALYEYVVWLSSKDTLAPTILFTFRVWGSTRLSDRIISVTADSIEKDQKTVEKCVELALGLREHFGYTIEGVWSDIAADIYDSIDPEDRWPSGDPVPRKKLLTRTSHKVLSELATYFEFIRNSLRNILIDIDKYKDQERLLNNESFWLRFVTKAKADGRVETQLWDFKKTLEMWHCQPDKKTEFEIDFSEQVCSYANTNGGVLIIGITNELPRKVVGIEDLENKIKATKTALDRFIQNAVPVHFQQIRLKDESGKDCDCLIIAIAQTENVVQVKNQQGWVSYPIRQGTGKGRGNPDTIRQSKALIEHDNYNFIKSLDAFVSGKWPSKMNLACTLPCTAQLTAAKHV